MRETAALIAYLPDRSVLEITGADRVTYLNGLVSNDVAQASAGRAIWAALLTPQGKYLADFFVFTEGARLLLDCAAEQASLLAQRLGRFRLRADVRIVPLEMAVYAGWGAAAVPPGIAAPDPRLQAAGWRALSNTPIATTATHAQWDAHRLALGLPDGARDLEVDKSVLLEAGFDELNGISWTKGCYMGQELTARTRYRGLLKRRLLPVRGDAPLPPPGTPVLAVDGDLADAGAVAGIAPSAAGREVGVLRSSNGTLGLALLRLDSLNMALRANSQAVRVDLPAWVRLPEPPAEPSTVPASEPAG